MFTVKQISRGFLYSISGSRLSRFRSKQGAASALIILLIVLLIFFGMLAMVTASADLRLAQRRADWTQAYYLADQQAEKMIAQLDSILLKSDPLGEDQSPVFQAVRQFLEQHDAAQVIALYEVDAVIFAEILVFDAGLAPQGIQFSVVMRPGQSDASQRLSIISWLQWQPPAEPAEKPGLWDGE